MTARAEDRKQKRYATSPAKPDFEISYRNVPCVTFFQNCINRSALLDKMAVGAKNKQEFRRRLCRAWKGTCVSDIYLQQLQLTSS